MEETLTLMWNNLSLSENEAITTHIDPLKLSPSKNALVAKIARKKYATLFEVDKGFKSMWNVPLDLETTVIGENLYLLSFSSDTLCERILEKQPWNYRGALVILAKVRGDDCPSDLLLHEVPFWIKIHGLQFRAMNRAVGEELGALFGGALEIDYDEKGRVRGKCIRLRAIVDVHKPLLWWSNVCINGSSTKIIFRYEKLADFCLFCGRLDHLEKACKLFHPDGLHHYGSWLRANSSSPTSMDEIANELNRINENCYTPGSNPLPHTPSSRDLFTPSPAANKNVSGGLSKCFNTPIQMRGLQDLASPIPGIDCKLGPSVPPNFENSIRLNWKALIPEQIVKDGGKGKAVDTDPNSSSGHDLGSAN